MGQAPTWGSAVLNQGSRKWVRALCLAAGTLWLSACGGGGGGSDDAPLIVTVEAVQPLGGVVSQPRPQGLPTGQYAGSLAGQPVAVQVTGQDLLFVAPMVEDGAHELRFSAADRDVIVRVTVQALPTSVDEVLREFDAFRQIVGPSLLSLESQLTADGLEQLESLRQGMATLGTELARLTPRERSAAATFFRELTQDNLPASAAVALAGRVTRMDAQACQVTLRNGFYYVKRLAVFGALATATGTVASSGGWPFILASGLASAAVLHYLSELGGLVYTSFSDCLDPSDVWFTSQVTNGGTAPAPSSRASLLAISEGMVESISGVGTAGFLPGSDSFLNEVEAVRAQLSSIRLLPQWIRDQVNRLSRWRAGVNEYVQLGGATIVDISRAGVRAVFNGADRVNSTLRFTFDADQRPTEPVTVTFVLQMPNGRRHPQQVTIVPTPQPTLTGRAFEVGSGQTYAGLFNASNFTGFELVTPPAHGEVSLPSGDGEIEFSYRPASGYFGPDSFEVRAVNGDLRSETARFDVTVGCPYYRPGGTRLPAFIPIEERWSDGNTYTFEYVVRSPLDWVSRAGRDPALHFRDCGEGFGSFQYVEETPPSEFSPYIGRRVEISLNGDVLRFREVASSSRPPAGFFTGAQLLSYSFSATADFTYNIRTGAFSFTWSGGQSGSYVDFNANTITVNSVQTGSRSFVEEPFVQ